MRFLLDESVNFPAAVHLRALGDDVKSVVGDFQAGLGDPEVLAIALREQRILVTNDRDFGELTFQRGLSQAGIVLFRLESEDRATKLAWLKFILEAHADDLRHFVVITPRGVRINRM